MSERLSAEIWLGGKLESRHVPELCGAICAEGVSREWGGAAFEPRTAEDLRVARKGLNGAAVVYVCSETANWGEFDELEAWLGEYGLPYTRRTGSSDCYDGELVESRPGREIVTLPTNANGRPVVDIETVQKTWYLLKEAQQALRAGSNALQPISEAADLLATVLPPELPPLEPFEIVGKT